MGIQGLLPLLKSIMVPFHIKDLKGCSVAVDTYSWLHKGALSCSKQLCKSIPTSRHIDYCMHRVKLLRHYGVEPILVFDGGLLPMKIEQENKRARVRDFFSSTPSFGCDWALVVRGPSGLDETVEGVGFQSPLCAVLKDGSLWVMDSVEEKSKGNMSDVVEEMQERENPGNKWDESSLVKFSKSLGFSTEGVEGKILKLLLRLKTRRDQGKKKGTLGLTRSAVGGVVVLWDNRVLELMGMEVGLFSISCRFKNVEDGFRWIFSGVYGPTLRRYRELFWEELQAIRGLWNDPWCVGGDFNMIRFPNECRRGGRVSSSMRRFLEVIDDLDLRDLPLQGGPFTWSGGLNSQTMSRLDRFLVTEDWEGYFNEVVQSTLPKPMSDHFPILLDGEGLEEAFTKEEVFSALSDLNGDKASGPDGFSLSFWQFSWDFVKEEVMCFLKEFHEHGRFVRSLNSTFLVLIPKKMGAEDLRDFRPISLVGGLYKLLAKVLANRLKKVMGKVVSSAQNAFVEGRQILDAVLIANEAIDSMLKRNESGVLCKLDIEKAYDHLNWNFLLLVLAKNGFQGEVDWLDILGDPLSPYLFVIGMEAFSRLILRAVRWGLLSGCRIKGRRGDGTLVSHLLFANDTLVFCDTSQDQMTYLSWLLMWFEAISGLRINLDKSEILPVGRVENLEVLALEVGCKVGKLPTSYLGIPLGRITSPCPFGMGWKRGSGKGLPCGKDNLSPKAGE
ncbi:Exonuclease 1 [Vitis vinifera]|uniref:Exonuclease 1 n=1 Tax=Vitis vinifera TaxID=29760 RepID=A0A438H3D4_VITVI|nr:Exonuclease 1 [Vitis vinifera]